MYHILCDVRCIVLKIAFYVSGSASRLIKLFQKDSKILESTKLIVFDNPPFRTLQSYAKEKDIKLIEIDYNKLHLFKKERNLYLSDTMLRYFKNMQITHCFCFGRLLLIGDLLKIYQNKIINFHPSILPLFAGNKAIDKALESKSFLLGNTAHFIDEGMDSGPIIMQSIIKASEFKDYESVLSMQIPMIEQIYNYLENNAICIKNNAVSIQDSINYPAFFPNLNNKSDKRKQMKVVFVGNRLGVLDEILQSNLEIEKILIQKDSYAHKNTRLTNIIIFDSKEQLLDEIKHSNFDLLISNGCPYILPVSQLKKPHQLFINIHPSLLPKLRGKHPINGAILFNTNAGVSVHTMSDEIDRGQILANITIPIKNLSLPLLYKLCFRAEAMAFKMAMKNDFKPIKTKPYKESYYSRPNEIKLTLNSSNKKLIRTINAFGMESITASIITNIGEFRVLEIKKIKNKFLKSLRIMMQNYEIIESYEDKILLFKDDEFLEFRFASNQNLANLKSKVILWGGGSLNELFNTFYNTYIAIKKYCKTIYFQSLQGGAYALS